MAQDKDYLVARQVDLARSDRSGRAAYTLWTQRYRIGRNQPFGNDEA